jgi:hypothetical protein
MKTHRAKLIEHGEVLSKNRSKNISSFRVVVDAEARTLLFCSPLPKDSKDREPQKEVKPIHSLLVAGRYTLEVPMNFQDFELSLL